MELPSVQGPYGRPIPSPKSAMHAKSPILIKKCTVPAGSPIMSKMSSKRMQVRSRSLIWMSTMLTLLQSPISLKITAKMFRCQNAGSILKTIFSPSAMHGPISCRINATSTTQVPRFTTMRRASSGGRWNPWIGWGLS